MMIGIVLTVLFLSAPATDATCNEEIFLRVLFNIDNKVTLMAYDPACLGGQTCDQLRWPGLPGDGCIHQPTGGSYSVSTLNYYYVPVHLPGTWNGNVATFRLLGETMNVTKEFDFGPDYGYFPTYGGVRGSLSRVDNNNEFFGIRLQVIRREDNSVVQEGEKVGISTPVSIKAVAENIPDYMTASVYDLKMVGQDTSSTLEYKLWNRGYPFSSCLTCEGKRNKVDDTVEIWENSFPEFSKTMQNNVDDKIQVKYEITVTACGDSRRKCRSDVIGGMMEVKSRSRIRREVKQQELPDFLDNEPIEKIVQKAMNEKPMIQKPMIERPIILEKNEKIRISFGANVALLATYFVVVNYAFIKYNTSKQ